MITYYNDLSELNVGDSFIYYYDDRSNFENTQSGLYFAKVEQIFERQYHGMSIRFADLLGPKNCGLSSDCDLNEHDDDFLILDIFDNIENFSSIEEINLLFPEYCI